MCLLQVLYVGTEYEEDVLPASEASSAPHHRPATPNPTMAAITMCLVISSRGHPHPGGILIPGEAPRTNQAHSHRENLDRVESVSCVEKLVRL